MNRAGSPRYRTPHTPPTSTSVLTRRFFEALAERRINISTAASDAGMTRVALQYWKSGQRNADIIVIEHLCRQYGIELRIP